MDCGYSGFAAANQRVYFAPVADNIQAFQLSSGLLSTTPTSRSSVTYGGRGRTMSISANGNTNGILWALQTNGSTAPGTRHAYDATNLGNELYNGNQAGTRDTLDTWLKSPSPSSQTAKSSSTQSANSPPTDCCRSTSLPTLDPEVAGSTPARPIPLARSCTKDEQPARPSSTR